MDHFAGLDVSVKDTSVCIVDDTGKIIWEVRVASEPHALLAVLTNPAYHFKRIGLEAGPLSQWLFSALAEAGLPVICVETRHMRAALKAQTYRATVDIPARFRNYTFPRRSLPRLMLALIARRRSVTRAHAPKSVEKRAQERDTWFDMYPERAELMTKQ